MQHGSELLAMDLTILNRFIKNRSSLVNKIHTHITVGISLINNHGCSLAISQSFEVFCVKYFHSDFKWQIIYYFLKPDQHKIFKIVAAYILCLPTFLLYSRIILKKKNVLFLLLQGSSISWDISLSHSFTINVVQRKGTHSKASL